MRPVLLIAAAGALTACGGDATPSGADEPFRLQNVNAQFFRGELPGIPAEGAPEDPGVPVVTAFEFTNTTATPGAVGKDLRGRVTEDAVSVGLAVPGVGSGYWVVPVGPPDPQFPGEISWSARADLSLDFPSGRHDFMAVGLDAKGRAGVQAKRTFCILPSIPDNGHVCDPGRPLPAAVVALRWDVPADLDLQAVTPTGRLVAPGNPLVEAPPTDDPFGEKPVHPERGVIDHDSGSGCRQDALMQEALVFLERPSGTFTFYAHLADPCGESTVHFELSVWVPDGTGDRLKRIGSKSGSVTALDARGGEAARLRITSVTF